MLYTGMVSVTFRGQSPRRIIELAKTAGLDGIEWGGDIHVPHGDTRTAEQVGRLTCQAGLSVPSYDSYYHAEEEELRFETVLATARALQAPNVRIWAGNQGSVETSPAQRSRICDTLKRAVELAAKDQISVSTECHGGTLTDTPESLLLLLEQVPGLMTYWQPLRDRDAAQELELIETVSDRLTNIHVYHWVKGVPQELRDGQSVWRQYLSALARQAKDRYLLMEFVKGDSHRQFLEDAAVLKAWVQETQV